MAKPKISPKLVKTTDTSVELNTSLNSNNQINDHINNKDIHIDQDTRDAISNTRKDVDRHIANKNIHITSIERDIWNSKETPNGAQSKANKVLTSLNVHKADRNVHLTKLEKESYADKYTKAEVRNLVKHTLSPITFKGSVNSRLDLGTQYPNPDFNSCVYIKSEKITLVFNGKEWVDFNLLLTPEVDEENDGLMTKEDKAKLDTIETNANYYAHPDNVDTRHVSDAQISKWDSKAENKVVDHTSDGLMTKEDKTKLDAIETNANYYTHPDTHNPEIIVEDKNHRFVSDEQISKWDDKIDVDFVKELNAKLSNTLKANTDTKIAAAFNSTEKQLQVLRSLAFELKNDSVVKNFLDLYNKCAKTEELKDHIIDKNIHITKEDRSILSEVQTAIKSGLNSDWNEDNQSSVAFINNKPKSLPANGGNADTLDYHKAEELFNNKSFYDATIGTPNYTSEDVTVITTEDTLADQVLENLINIDGKSVLFRQGTYKISADAKECIIKASNSVISGFYGISKFIGLSIKIIGNNNTIQYMTFDSDKGFVKSPAIYIEGNNNIIKSNTINNYSEGIIIEGSNNTIENNFLTNISNEAIQLTSDNNANYGNNVLLNKITKASLGIVLLSGEYELSKNYITKNNVLNSNTGIILSNTYSDSMKTVNNIISDNIVMKGKGESTNYLPTDKTIVSEFSSKNIITSNITSGKEIIPGDNMSTNNLY